MENKAVFSLDARLQESTHFVISWPLSQVLLSKNAAYPWLILVPMVPNARELLDLTPQQQHQFLLESNAASYWLLERYKPTKLNVAALGNIVSQLHVHHIARFESDPAWPNPIWGCESIKEYTQKELDEIIYQVNSIVI